MSTAVHWPSRFAEMVEFVGVTEEDRRLIKASAALVMAHARKMNEAIYQHILQYPQARKFFVTANDEPDGPRIEANIQTMLSWLRASGAAPGNDGFARYIAGISQMHMNIPIHREHLSPVAPRYIIGIISYYQTAIAEILRDNMEDLTLASRTSVAWNKWLMAQVDLLLGTYLAHDSEG